MKHFKYIFTILTLLIVSGFAFSQDNNCLKSMRTGVFEYELAKGEVVVKRTKKIQTETYNNGKTKLILKVDWINDSSYVLTFKKIINTNGCTKVGDKIYTTITKCDGQKYTCRYSTKNCGNGICVFIKKKE